MGSKRPPCKPCILTGGGRTTLPHSLGGKRKIISHLILMEMMAKSDPNHSQDEEK